MAPDRNPGDRQLGPRITLVAVAVVLALAALSPVPARGAILFPNFSWPPLLLTLNPDLPAAGDVVTLDAEAFVDGLATDADAVPSAFATVNAQNIAIPMARVDLGHYRGTFSIPTANLSPIARSYDGLVGANATIHGLASTSGMRFRWSAPGLAIRVTSDSSRIDSGQPFQVTGQVLRNGMPVDPDTIQVVVTQGSNFLGGNASPTREGVGLFVANLTLSSPAGFSPLPLAMFEAQVGGVAISGGMLLQIPRYQVWLHQLPSPSGVLHGELWVANFTGAPVPGVSLSFTNITGLPVSGVTDARGAFPVYINASGTLGFGTQVDAAAGTPFADFAMLGVVPQLTTTVLPLDPVILPDGSLRDDLRPGQPVMRSFRLLNASSGMAPYPDIPVSYYVYSLDRVVASGTARTNATGVVQVAFTAPPERVQVAFFAGTERIGLACYVVGSARVSLASTPLRFGSLTTVGLSLPADLQAPLDPDASVLWDVRPLGLPAGEDWSLLTRTFDDDFVRTGGGTAHAFALPSFLPVSGPFLVSGTFSLGYGTLAQFAVLSAGASASVPFNTTYQAPPGINVEVVLALVVVGAAAVGVAVWLVVRRRPPPAPRR